MSRGLWFAAGAGAGIYAVVRGRRAAEAFTIDGLGDRLTGLALGARMFRDEVAAGRTEKETELRRRLALAPDGPAARPAARPADGRAELTATPAEEDTSHGHR